MLGEAELQLLRDVGLPGVLVLYFVRWLTNSLDKKLNALFNRVNESIKLQGAQADTIEAMGRQIDEQTAKIDQLERALTEAPPKRRLPSKGEKE